MPVQSRLEARAAAPTQDPHPRACHCVTSGWGALSALRGGGVIPFPHLVFPLASDATKETPPFHGRKRGCRVKRAERALELAEPLLTVTSSRSFHQ